MVKKACPEQSRRVYLDYAATTPLDPRVLRVMMPYFRNKFGNPSSVHSWGQEARRAVEEARARVAKILGCQTSEIFFTGTTTTSDNLAILGLTWSVWESKITTLGKKAARPQVHLITSQIEHNAVLDTFKYLEKRGFRVSYLSVDRHGLINLKDLERAINPETILVSVMYANNEVGTIEPIKEISHLLRAKVYFHTDAATVADYLPLDVQNLGVNLLTLGAHKFGGPKGVGLLYIKKGTPIDPLTFGGHHEKGLWPGTEPVPLIVGMAEALEIAQKEKLVAAKKEAHLRDRLIKGILTQIPGSHLTGHPTKRLPDIASFVIEGVEGEAMLLILSNKGIAASSGSACTSGILKPSHVLTAMGIPAELAHGSIRFSLGKQTTNKDIDYVLKVFPKVVTQLRKMAPKL